jgi:hypothetical protein
VISTEDDPPLELSEGAEIIPIDESLGLYSPDSQEIIIFQKGIQRASDILRVNPEHINIVVRLHEWAHAILHLGVAEDDRLKIVEDDSHWNIVLNASTKLFKEMEHGLHELLAQTLTLYCIQYLKQASRTDQGKDASGRIEYTFHHLASRQPPEYRIHDLLNVPRARILRSIGLLRNRFLVGKVEPWKTVVTW